MNEFLFGNILEGLGQLAGGFCPKRLRALQWELPAVRRTPSASPDMPCSLAED
jgi:hypothetical protein